MDLLQKFLRPKCNHIHSLLSPSPSLPLSPPSLGPVECRVEWIRSSVKSTYTFLALIATGNFLFSLSIIFENQCIVQKRGNLIDFGSALHSRRRLQPMRDYWNRNFFVSKRNLPLGRSAEETTYCRYILANPSWRRRRLWKEKSFKSNFIKTSWTCSSA